MQINSRNKTTAFKGLYLTPDVKQQEGFMDVIDYLMKNATKNDLFVRTIEEQNEATKTSIKRFQVNAQTLSGDMGFEEKSENLSVQHLKESVDKALKGLTDKLLNHHSIINPPPAEKARLEVKMVQITPNDIMNIMTHNRQN